MRKRTFVVWLISLIALTPLAFSGTGTVPQRTTGQVITQSFFNDTTNAITEDFVGRNSAGVATSGQSIGTAIIPWGPLFLGGAVDMAQISTPATPAAGRVKVYPKADGLFYKKNSAGVESALSPAGSGDVAGPVSSVDSRIATYNGTTGKVIKDSGVLASIPGTNSVSVGASHPFQILPNNNNSHAAWFGTQTGENIATSSNNSFSSGFGYRALYNLGSNGYGESNSAFGAYSGPFLTQGSSNLFVGYGAGGNTGVFGGGQYTGGGSTFLGVNSGVRGTTAVNYSTAIGAGAAVTANNQLVVGGHLGAFIDNAYFGAGVVDATPPVSVTIQSTGGEGTNIAGTTTRIAAGRGTGNAGSTLALATGAVLGSGSALQTLTDRLTLTESLASFSTVDVAVSTAGKGLRVKEGSNAKQGVSTLVAGTVTVSNTSVTASSRIFLTCQDPNGGVPGVEYISARTVGTDFTITSSAADTCIVAWQIFEPAA